ncbi:MAG TPA: hypothetical protein PKV27_05200 [Ilumatobacteraceae bacterium]|nr:hypothetical protein [Ilumatobacteraceae bacterium]
MQLGSVLPRLRMLFARRPWIYWGMVLIAAALVALIIVGNVRAVQRQRASWGNTVAVWVATGDIAAGQPVVVTARQYPAAMVPERRAVSNPSGQLAMRPIGRGEVVIADDVSRSGISGLVLTDHVAMTLTYADKFLRVGDPVVVLAESLSADGVVVATGDRAIMVSVHRDVAASIASANTRSAVSVALRSTLPRG